MFVCTLYEINGYWSTRLTWYMHSSLHTIFQAFKDIFFVIYIFFLTLKISNVIIFYKLIPQKLLIDFLSIIYKWYFINKFRHWQLKDWFLKRCHASFIYSWIKNSMTILVNINVHTNHTILHIFAFNKSCFILHKDFSILKDDMT